MYECTESAMSVLPLADVLDMKSGDNWPGTVIGILDKKMRDPWFQPLVDRIREEGFTVPIRVDSDHWVVDGHHRIAAAVMLGMEWIPVISEEWPDHDHCFREENSPEGWDTW